MRRGVRRLSARDLRELIKEELDLEPSDKKQQDSIDNQIDRFFSQSESDAVERMDETFNWRSTTRRLLEADDEEGEGDEDSGEDEQDDVSSEPEKKTIDDIDVEEFATSVIRLVQNFDNLIETRSTIVRRALNFLDKTYDDTVKETFLSILRDEEGLSPDESEREVEEEEFTAPFAGRAGPLGSG